MTAALASEGSGPRGKKKMLAAALWKVHPAVGIRFVNP